MRRPRYPRLLLSFSLVAVMFAMTLAPLHAMLAGLAAPRGKRWAGSHTLVPAPATRPVGPLQARVDAAGLLRRAYFPPSRGLVGRAEDRARQLLSREAARLGIPADLRGITSTGVRRSPSGTHVRFVQSVDGIPVHGAEAVASFDPTLRPTLLASDLVPRFDPRAAPPAALPRAVAVEIAGAWLGIPASPPAARAELFWRRVERTWRRAFRVRFVTTSPPGDWEIWVDAARGRILDAFDRTVYATPEGPRGRVFVPDPVLATGDRTLDDGDDADAAVPSTAYRDVPLAGLTAGPDGAWRLEGPYVALEDWEAPWIPPATSTTGEFLFGRSQPGFEDVMAYHHLDAMQRWYQSLGFTDANRRAQPVDAHGLDGRDNSKYVPSLGKLAFGEGGVDDAEDAAVLVHEYGHATQYDLVPTWGSGGHTLAMGEGFGDYLANSYAWDLQPQRVEAWNGVFMWDGHNVFWPGRPAIDPTLRYPADATRPPHTAGTLWCSALTDALYRLGDRRVMDRLVLDHHYALTGSATMEDAANAILVSDVVLEGGTHLGTLAEVFQNWGMLAPGAGLAVLVQHTPLADAALDESPPRIEARVLGLLAPVDPGGVTLYAQESGGPAVAVPMLPGPDATWSAAWPWPRRASWSGQYWIEALDIDGNAGRFPATGSLTVHMGWIAEDFEDPGGWQAGLPTDTAVAGAWVRAAPVGTLAQPGRNHTPGGAYCFVTGNLPPGSPASDADVDGGVTTLLSPVYDLRGFTNVRLQYWRWFSNDLGTAPGEDVWEVAVSPDAGITWIPVESTTQSHAAWERHSVDLDSLLGPAGNLQLRFRARDEGAPSLVEAAVDDVLLQAQLPTDTATPVARVQLANHPNPFNPYTTVTYTIPRAGRVQLDVVDVRGRRLRRLVDARQEPGDHRIVWDGRDAGGRPLASGIYLARLRAAGAQRLHKLTLLR